MTSRKFLLPSILAGFVLVASASGASYIANGEFETGNLTGWTQVFGAGGTGSSIESATPLTGSHSLKMVRTNQNTLSQALSSTITSATITPTITLDFKYTGATSGTGDRVLNFSASGTTGAINMRITGAGTLQVFGTANGGAGTAAWTSTSITGLSFNTPYSLSLEINSFGSGGTYDIAVGTATATGLNIFQNAPLANLASIAFASNNSYTTSTVFIDNVAVVPEPSAALLGGFGLVALLRRRR